MRKCKSYRIQDFLDESFKMPQYFALIHLIDWEGRELEKEIKKANKKK